jgi:hypothetical protein
MSAVDLEDLGANGSLRQLDSSTASYQSGDWTSVLSMKDCSRNRVAESATRCVGY